MTRSHGFLGVLFYNKLHTEIRCWDDASFRASVQYAYSSVSSYSCFPLSHGVKQEPHVMENYMPIHGHCCMVILCKINKLLCISRERERGGGVKGERGGGGGRMYQMVLFEPISQIGDACIYVMWNWCPRPVQQVNPSWNPWHRRKNG